MQPVDGTVDATDLAGSVAIVTGAGRGILQEVAIQLARADASVLVADTGGGIDGNGSDASVAELVAAEIRRAGGSAIASADSVATLAGATAIIDAALSEFGRVDVLVNGAGTITGRTCYGTCRSRTSML
jgi:NAD(P)-dependent dehydrogenase (short-subunit alcohol dehydrogenase family)